MNKFQKHLGDRHAQQAHASNYGRGVVIVPNYISIMGDAATKGLSDADTIQVLIKDDAMAPMYWRENVAALVRRVLNQGRLGKPVTLIFRPEGTNLPAVGAFDLVLRRAGNQVEFRKSADQAPASLKHDGAMVALHIDPTTSQKLHVPGGTNPSEHHITLAYLGKGSDIGRTEALHEVVKRVASRNAPLSGTVGGKLRFSPHPEGDETQDPYAAHVDAPGIHELRADLVNELKANEFYPSERHSYTPHITLARLAKNQADPHINIPRHPLNFSSMHVHVNDDTTEYPLRGTPNQDQGGGGAIYATGFDDPAAYTTKAAGEFRVYFTKASVEKRYTLGVLYKASAPGDLHLDAHGEFTTADELQAAQWRYVRSGNRRIFLQHGLTSQAFRQAGEWVDIIQWPFELSVPFQKDGQTTQRTVPAGSLYLGVVWEPWAWMLVRNGEIRGFSFGGRTDRVTVTA